MITPILCNNAAMKTKSRSVRYMNNIYTIIMFKMYVYTSLGKCHMVYVIGTL